MARKNSSKGSHPETEKTLADPRLLDRLAPEEANAVLHGLLKTHPELQSEAEELARNAMSSPSIEEIADDVFHALTSLDPDALNGRAGSHSCGYVEPGEAAVELLEESMEHLIDDMNRQAELGLAAGAEAICVGIVEGLYRARSVNSDGALGWAPDFPIEQADQVLQEFFRSSAPAAKLAGWKSMLEILAARTPEWTDMLRRAADPSGKG